MNAIMSLHVYMFRVYGFTFQTCSILFFASFFSLPFHRSLLAADIPVSTSVQIHRTFTFLPKLMVVSTPTV